MDEDGYFRLVARRADMWYPDKEMGPPAFPRDIEEVLYEIPQVQEAAVVAIANQPIAFISTGKDGTTSETVMAYCRRRLPPELVPRMVIFVDAFPRSFIGKILRRELAQRYGSTGWSEVEIIMVTTSINACPLVRLITASLNPSKPAAGSSSR